MFDIIRRPSSSLGLSTIEELDNLFDNFLKTSNFPVTAGGPSVNIFSKNDKEMVVELEAPGFDKDDIVIDVREGVLEIRGDTSRKEETGDQKRNYLIRESRASFARRIVLPEGANTDNVTAELDKGMLKITVPVERPEARRIEISAKSGGQKLTSKSQA
jgi:HSP20 family protein